MRDWGTPLREFLSWLPDGQISHPFVQAAVKPPSKKYFCFTESKIILYSLPSRPTEGRCATSSTRGGMRWTPRARGRTCLTRTAKSCGPGASTPASSPAGVIPAGRRRQTSPISGESTKETVKTIAQGRPGRSGEPVVTTLVYFDFLSYARLRVHRAPGFPCALCYLRADASGKTRAKNMRRDREDVSCLHCDGVVVIAGLDPAIHQFSQEHFRSGWMAGSSPAMTR